MCYKMKGQRKSRPRYERYFSVPMKQGRPEPAKGRSNLASLFVLLQFWFLVSFSGFMFRAFVIL
jgi:hypothetical protein